MTGRKGIPERWSGQPKAEIVIWLGVISVSFILLQLALRSSPSLPPADLTSLYRQRRSRLYDSIAKDLDEKGLAFLNQLDQNPRSLIDAFTIENGTITPVLKPANPPVRANALYLPPEFSTSISRAVNDTFGPYFDEAIWFQDPYLYHFSMFHASHHLFPVPASKDEVEAEARAVRNVIENLCPLEVFLDRVILTPSGVLLGCWQVTSGSDPITIRSELRRALPRAPEKQAYDAAILHTSFARVLGHPKPPAEDAAGELRFLHKLVTLLNDKISGIKAVVSELWYVEEYDVFALAYRGRMKTRKFQLRCRETSNPLSGTTHSS